MLRLERSSEPKARREVRPAGKGWESEENVGATVCSGHTVHYPNTHSGSYFPDLFASHLHNRIRWIEFRDAGSPSGNPPQRVNRFRVRETSGEFVR